MRDGRWPLVGAATMRALDRHTIETLGVPGEVLMESAGRAVAEAVLAEAPEGPVLVVCGTGNNGGDGLVVARHLHGLGIAVKVALLGEPARLRGDAATNLARLRALGIEPGGAGFRTAGFAVLVDAIFGTGLAREPRGEAAAAIRRINAARPRARVVAVDLPSGWNADTGQPLGPAVEADVTVTLGLPKLGLVFEPGRTAAGRVLVARIGIADAAPDVEADAELWTAEAVAHALPARPGHGHKGSFGHLLLVAGSRGKTGAAALAAHGAARVGAGLVTIACPAGLNEILEVKCTEMMTAPVPDTADQGLAHAALAPLAALARERDAVALGPGIGRADETGKLVRDLVARVTRPLVIDADGLFPFAGALDALAARRAPTIVTPHPGEAGRLLGIEAAAVNADRLAAARRLAEASGAVVLLKGAASVIADPDGRVAVNPTGGPELGSGGTGDVLTGMVASFVAQGVEPWTAAVLGAWVHGRAGDRWAAVHGSAGLLAGELADGLPETLKSLRGAAPVAGSSLALPFP